MKQRIIWGLLAGAAFVALLLAGGWFYAATLVGLALLGFNEYTRMNGHTWNEPASLLGYAGVLLFVLPWKLMGVDAPSAITVLWSLAFLLLAVTVFTKNKITIDGASLMLLGALYVGYGFSSMNAVRELDHHGIFWSFLIITCNVASDAGAYFVGRAMGKHKLWPSISPNKTIEGALGGVVLAIVAAWVFALCAPSIIEIPNALLIGLFVAVAGQLGDLIQSAYKRVRNIKDSGSILPGHGGVLDRFDSWIIVFPLLILTELIPT
ncbi:phosphatidate cytidylyltransferase [Paenibacillus glycanilyticus]|uniref:Phosphatidate cytidylyltransferase n=1 Tax=Paenibacillus glycanilyticus TaxID=126569 RepID=A0ABQ6GD12_9BACL|nr:phosphatidate cytidylyltransferase [Paenibacillus glycanilyticus]GLX68517.1 phosphatidate cytidylyltransferase [Paenibacillus glycanilyticus]